MAVRVPTYHGIEPRTTGQSNDAAHLDYTFLPNGVDILNEGETMTSLNHIKSVLSLNRDRLFKQYPLANMAIFGSFARNEQREDSDVDILVEFNAPVGIEFIDLADDLERILNRKVDLVSKQGVKPNYLAVIQNQLSYV